MKIIPLVLLLLLLKACAKPLQPDNYPELIDSTQLNHNTFQVSYRRNSASVDEKAVDLALLRSAEVALGNGYNYFIIVQGSESDGLPIKADANSYVQSDPGATNTIVCFKEKPEGVAYVALFVKASLRSKYRLDQATE